MFGVVSLTAPKRFVSSAAWWALRGSWAWITLKPGSRPRRAARKLVGAAVSFVVAQPLLARIRGKRSLDVRSSERQGTPSLDALSSEREQFVHARLRAALEKRLS